jgi:signal transduction histidine kinase
MEALVDAQIGRLGTRKGVHVERDLPPDLPPVMVDETQVGQVLLNLLLNGAQAMGETGGTLHVRARSSGDGEVEVSVEDEGEGIAPKNMEKIFEPLFTTKARGIGLGLAVSRALAEKNRGSLTASSPPGRGAVFTLSLPTTAPTEAA